MRTLVLIGTAIFLTACGTKAPVEKEPEKKREPVRAPAVFKVRMETTGGPVISEIHREWAPRGADHFYMLITEKFYDGVKFHRVLRDFVAQFGISPDGQRDRMWRGYELIDDPMKTPNKRGTLTFATRGPNTRTTQMFFNLADNLTLDKDGFAPVGRVLAGMEVLDRLTFFYGDTPPRGRGPDPRKIQALGYGYLLKEFPRLDTITTARVVD